MNINKGDKDHPVDKLFIFKELFTRYHAPLLLYAVGIVHDKDAAEDILQEVFLALWTNKDTIDFGLSLQPYLYKAVYHRSLNYLNVQKEKMSIEENEENILLNLHKDFMQYLQYNQHDHYLLDELRSEINRSIETLPEKCRIVFRLSREEGLKNKEIAEKLNISEKTVESHMSKALKLIRDHLIKIGLLGLFFLFMMY